MGRLSTIVAFTWFLEPLRLVFSRVVSLDGSLDGDHSCVNDVPPSSLLQRTYQKADSIAHVDLVSVDEKRTQVSQAAQRVSLGLDHRLQMVADGLPRGTTRSLLKALRLCAPCETFERFGEDADGGYVMCMDSLDKGNTLAAFSYGIDGFDGWGMDIAKKYMIPLHEYDCTSGITPCDDSDSNDCTIPTPCDGCDVRFHKECILNADGVASDSSFKTLAAQLMERGFADAPHRSLIGKIDIEGAEWSLFAEEPVANLQKFKQIVTELHWMDQEQEYPLYLKALRNLRKAGFVPAHLHGNNFGGADVHIGEYTIPNVIEVTFVPRPIEGCYKHLPMHVAQDMPNDPNIPDTGGFNLPADTGGFNLPAEIFTKR